MPERIIRQEVNKILPARFMPYALGVIQDRALCDVRDGLKPIHRRILYSMYQMKLFHNVTRVKCAGIVGDVLGKWHPHGDASAYEALVYLSQEWKQRYPSIDFAGNRGSIDGDSAAAMRYTNARLSAFGEYMLNDIFKNVTDMKPNYDNSRLEPVVLGSLIPNLILNGTSGIAVGMASSIPSHNLNDVYNCLDYIIECALEGKEPDEDKVIELIKAPDFATGGIVSNFEGIRQAYKTGKGRCTVRGKYHLEENDIVFDEIPFGVNKQQLILSTLNLIKDVTNDKGQITKKALLPEIREVRDESDKDGIRIVVELKRNMDPEVVVNKLFSARSLNYQKTISIDFTAINGLTPKVYNLISYFDDFIMHAFDVIKRRSRYDLSKAETRKNIVDALIKLFNENLIETVIDIIRNNDNPLQDIINLGFNETQANYILDMKIKQLSKLAIEKINEESKALNSEVDKLKAIINVPKNTLTALREEFKEIKEKFGDSRRTEISTAFETLTSEDLIKDENLIITFSEDGAIKAISQDEYRLQRRGGKGVKSLSSKSDDTVKAMINCGNKDNLLFFTNIGKCYLLKAYKIDKVNKTAKGRNVNNYLNLDAGERVVDVINQNADAKFIFFVTKQGIIKKLALNQLSTKFNSTKVITFKNDSDMLIKALLINDDNILIGTYKGNSIRIDSTKIKEQGRAATGVKGLKLNEDDYVVDMCNIGDKALVLTATENGYAKITNSDDWSVLGRGCKGVKGHNISEKTGGLVQLHAISANDELFIATQSGQVLRINAETIRLSSRSSIGVKLINLTGIDKVTSISIKAPEEVAE